MQAQYQLNHGGFMHGSSMDSYLFVKNPLQGVLQGLLRAATGGVEDMEAALMLGADPDAVAREIVAQWPFEIPVLDEACIYTTHEEVRGEVKDAFSGHIRRDVPMQQYVYHVPFAGNAAIFQMRPSTSISTPPMARVSGSELLVDFRELNPNADAMKSRFALVLSQIKNYLGWVQTDLTAELASIISSVTSAVQSRQIRIKQASAVAASLGYPLRKRDDAAQVAAPLKRKTIELSQTKASAPQPQLEPYLENSAFEAILDVIASMSLLIERNPSTFARIPEEVLRDHFLLQLNGQFQGRATGETFNANGKTDILLRDGDRNVFIAECKYWTGPKSLTDAINQLFSYLTWRDSKAAVLVFNRNKDFTRTIGEAERALKSHSQYEKPIATRRATSFRARMIRPDDKERKIDLIVMLFEVPVDPQLAVTHESPK
jgi:hypothetical protein